ncbi:MAG TPA: hypothetical protein VL098_13655 [Flavipsychrobacter sp.]|nr:hypothetical protein [Flavipsychrobacter sp.]
MQASTALYQLKTMPEAFLRNNLLIIAGGIILQEYAQYYIETVDPWDVAAHIQPGGNRGNGSELRSKIKNEGRFKDHPNTTPVVFGIGDYQGYAYVVGVRSGSQWQLFGQIVSGPGANIIDVVKIV